MTADNGRKIPRKHTANLKHLITSASIFNHEKCFYATQLSWGCYSLDLYGACFLFILRLTLLGAM